MGPPPTPQAVGTGPLSRRFADRWLPWLALGLGLFLMTYPMWLSGFRSVVGGEGDPRLVGFSLEHGWGWLARRPPHLSFWDPPLYYPVKNVAAYADLMFASGAVNWPWRLVHLSPATAFELWLLAALILDFWAFYAFLARGLSCTPAASGLGAFLFTFGSARAANAVHPQLLFELFVAGALWALARAFELTDAPASAGRRRLALDLVFLCLVLQTWSSFYPLFFSGVFLLVALLAALAVRSARRRLLRLLAADGVFLAIFASAAVLAVRPVVSHCHSASQLLGLRHWTVIQKLAPRLWSWVLLGETSRLYGWIHRIPAVAGVAPGHVGTRVQGLGLATPVLAALGLWWERRRTVTRLLVSVTLVVVVATTVAPGGVWLWPRVAGWIPGVRAVRALGRIGIYLLVPAGVGLAFLVDRMRLHLRRRFTPLCLVLLAVVGLEQAHRIPSYDKVEARQRVERIASHLGPECQAFYVSSRRPLPLPAFQADAMWAASLSGTPTINGRYGNFPPDYYLYRTDRGQAIVARGLAYWIRAHGLSAADVCWLEVRKGKVLRRPISAVPDAELGTR